MLKLVIFVVTFLIVLGILSIAVCLNTHDYEEERENDDEWIMIAF